MFVIALIVVLLSGALAFGVAVLVRRHASKLGLVQAPNERSSHTVPTPTGGGIGIVAGGTLAGLPMATLDPWLVMPVLVAGLLIAVIGYADDRRSLPVSWRLGGQVLLMGALIALIPTPALQAGLGFLSRRSCCSSC